MARAAAALSQAHAVPNDPGGANRVPPSTIAAQIVQNLSTGKGQSQTEGQRNFEQLLLAILGTANGSAMDDATIETDLSVNYELIVVVTRAGLDVLGRDDPFASVDQLLPQALNSIAVIQLTIQRNPDVLFALTESKSSFTSDSRPRLYLLLLPKLIGLLGNQRLDKIQDQLLELLGTMLKLTRTSPSIWVQFHQLSRYLLECVSGIVRDIEHSSNSVEDSFSNFLTNVQSANTSFADSQGLSGDQLQSVEPTVIKDPSQAIITVLRLLRLTSLPKDYKLPCRSGSRRSGPLTLTIDYLDRIMIVLDRVQDTPQLLRRLSEIVALFLQTVRAIAEAVSSWKDASVHLYASTTLARAVSQLLRWSSSLLPSQTQDDLCRALSDLSRMCRSSEQIRGIISDEMSPSIMLLIEEEHNTITMNNPVPSRWSLLDVDLQIFLWHFSEIHVPGFRTQIRPKDVNGVTFSEYPEPVKPDLDLQYRTLLTSEDSDRLENRQPKRRRLSKPVNAASDTDDERFFIQRVYKLLGFQSAADLDGLNLVSSDCYVKLSPEEQCVAFEYLGDLVCSLAGDFKVTRAEDGTIRGTQCSLCDSDKLKHSRPSHQNDDKLEKVCEIIQTISQLPEFQGSSKQRVWAMLTVRRLVLHSQDSKHVDLDNGSLGQWCLQSQQSSLRELRIAAGRTLPAFLAFTFDDGLLAQNKRVVLNHLRKLAASNRLSLQETCVLAWGQVALVSTDDELNIILLRLVEYLGHTNPLILADKRKLLRLSRHQDCTPNRLLSPFWRSIGITVVKDLQTRPQTAQLLSDLLGMTVGEFLILTQSYTLPYLVLLKKKDVIQRIAQARERGSTAWKLCMDSKNIASILALLLVQQPKGGEEMTMSLLQHVSSEFAKTDLTELAQSHPILPTFELLKAAGDSDGSTKRKVYEAIQFYANTSYRKPAQSKSSVKGDAFGQFFEMNVLGIVAQFSEVINDVNQSIVEKKRCLKGIMEMIILAKKNIGNAIPQICACLHSALAVGDLRDQALLTWTTMTANLEEEEMNSMIESTFSIVVQTWDTLPSETQQKAATMIGHLVKKHAQFIRENVNKIPSLASIPLLSKYEAEISKLKAQMDVRHQYMSFSSRCRHENITVVRQALLELLPYLSANQSFLHMSVVSEQPDSVISDLFRSILDACVRFTGAQSDISSLCAECIGLIGCIDPNRVDTIRKKRDVLVLNNFDRADETIDWVVYFLQEILVKAFMSATDTKAQAFLAYAMQELLKFCDFDSSVTLRPREAHRGVNYWRWAELPEVVRNTLTPFLTSRYVITANAAKQEFTYPIFAPNISHGTWLRAFVNDLLEKGNGQNAQMIFPVCSRVVRTQSIAIANFILPFAALNVIVSGTEQQSHDIGLELCTVLSHQARDESQIEKENLKLCSESVFQALDYLNRWMQEKRKANPTSRHAKNSVQVPDDDQTLAHSQIRRIESVLSCVPPEIISQRAVECKSFARALFHWEQYIRKIGDTPHDGRVRPNLDSMFERLQHIYTQIDEPDGMEGISAHLHVLNIDQQILEHRKAGRWTAAQSWYELQLAEKPEDTDVQLSLLTCLKESGQHDVLLNQMDGMLGPRSATQKLLPFAVEAAWMTGKWETLQKYVAQTTHSTKNNFNVALGQAMLYLHRDQVDNFKGTIKELRANISSNLSPSTTASLQACHDDLLKLHVLTEMEIINKATSCEDAERRMVLDTLDRRLDILGAFLSDKQYLLGVRRAILQLSRFPKDDLASAWLTSARLARKGNLTHQSFNAVLHASQLGATSATIEHSRLLWKEGQHRKAIQSLEGAIAANAFGAHNCETGDKTVASLAGELNPQQNLLSARAHLLLAKWLDSAGQTHSQSIIEKYQDASRMHLRWEKGHYYVGRHYNKLLESEKDLPPHKRSRSFIIGETTKLVVQAYLRSLAFGAKYIFQTLPRLLTLWLDLGEEVNKPIDPKCGNGDKFRREAAGDRRLQLKMTHDSLEKYLRRLPPFVFYTAMPQIVARICHSNPEVFQLLQSIIVRVVSTHPQHALWTLLAVVKSSSPERAARGASCLAHLKDGAKRTKVELRNLIKSGQKMSDQLLQVCEGAIVGKPTTVSLMRDLGFNHKAAPCPLVVPLETTLTADLPTIPDDIRNHKAFSRDIVTISSFLDDVLVLNSLQRPRKISVRGSDGVVYGLLCKPKDDLRKDQRLMEFNAMINRALKKDAETSKRRLYIKTYAVTPLNEECGLIEWVDGLKAMRDILLKLYKLKDITPNYPEIRTHLDEACSDPDKIHVFTDKIMSKFPPIFHEWFVEMFPDPEAWFTARLKYTRSCAVMSMVGMVLGLGDRHGENILFEEGNGGTFHVDFNCLFDKGLTFEKPELVPFRLTRNMVDAFGVYGYEGPFRKSCELTLSILRQNEETLMTILETFVYDPTADFIGKKKKSVINVPDTPQEVLDSVRGKVRGLLRGETVPLSVEGHVDELIQQAVSTRNLAAMYIGWCAFL